MEISSREFRSQKTEVRRKPRWLRLVCIDRKESAFHQPLLTSDFCILSSSLIASPRGVAAGGHGGGLDHLFEFRRVHRPSHRLFQSYDTTHIQVSQTLI